MISPSQSPLPKQHTTKTRNKHPCFHRYSNPQFHKSTADGRLIKCYFHCSLTAQIGSRSPHFWGFYITVKHITLSTIPLDEGSARRRDLYMTAHTRYKKQTSMTTAGYIILLFYALLSSLRYMNFEFSLRAITSDGLWHVCMCLSFPSFLLRSTIFGKIFRIKSVFGFCLQILSEVFLLPERILGYIVINIIRFSCQISDIYIRFKQTWIMTSYD